MPATVNVLGSSVFTTTAGNKTITATPTVGDLIIIITAATGVASTVSDNGTGGTYTQLDTTRTGFSTTGNLQMWVRDNLVSSASSTVYTATQTSSTGGGLVVLRITGATLAGINAIRSSGGQSSGGSGTTPAPVLNLTPNIDSIIIAAIANGTNSATTLVPRTGYTEVFDNGYNTPATGLEVNYRVGGETSATLTQGGNSASAFASQAIEIFVNTSPATVLNSPADASSGSDSTPTLDFTGTDPDPSSTAIDSYAFKNADLGSGSQLSSGFPRVSQSFTGNGTPLNFAYLYLSKANSPTGNVTVEIYAHSGTFGTSSVPTGSALATAINSVSAATLPTTDKLYEFQFDGTFTPVNGTRYELVVLFNGTASPNIVNVGQDFSSPTHGGNKATYNGTTWTADSTRDLVFSLHTAESIEYQIQIDTVNTFDSTLGTTLSYSETNQDSTDSVYLGGNQFIGESFAGTGENINTAKLYLKKTGSPAGNAVLRIYATTGTLGSGDFGTGSVLATSDNFSVSSLTTSFALATFTFSGANKINLASGTNYVIGIYYQDASSNGSNSVDVGEDSTSPTSPGRWIIMDNLGSWGGSNSFDTIFYVYTYKPLLNKVSETDSGFANPDTAGDTHPFNSGENIQFTVQAGDALADGTYYWRVRSKDTAGSNTYGAWSTTRSFTISTGGGGGNTTNFFQMF